MKNKISLFMDNEETERINHLMKKQECNLLEFFKYDKIKNALIEDYLIIQGSYNNNYNIISSLPVYSSIFIELCPGCVPNINKIIPLLNTGCVFPILINDYSTYPESFIKELIKYPHISNKEYFTTRHLSLKEDIEEYICPHCIKEKFSKIKIVGLNAEKKESIRETVDDIIDRLMPLSSSEEELLSNLELLLMKRDYKKIDKLFDISDAIFRIRTAQAFESPLYITDNIEVGDIADKYIPQLNQLLQFPEDILLKGLELEAPVNLNILKYIEIIMNNRDSIKGIAKHVIKQASLNGYINSIDTSNLLNEIAKLNDDVRRIQKSKKYKIFKIGSDILSANKGLITTLICAVTLGFQGNLIGCAASTSAGILGKVLINNEKINNIIHKLNLKGPTQELKDLILNSLEPSLQKMLSIYLSTDLRVIQTMRIKEQINQN